MTSSNHDEQTARRTELGAFLRACRARLTPADVGLSDGSASGRRRTPGLRREEIAQLSGVGVTWYTWLEQGRNISASIQVIDALARTLLLTGDQHRHLRELAGLPPPEPSVPAGDMLPGSSGWSMPRRPALASVYDEHFDYLVWNEPYAAGPARPRHAPRQPAQHALDDVHRPGQPRPHGPLGIGRSGRCSASSAPRPGRHPGDPRFTELVEALSEASPQFRDWWAEHPVRYFRPAVIAVRHPEAGLIQLEMFQLRLVDQPGLIMVVQVPPARPTWRGSARCSGAEPPTTAPSSVRAASLRPSACFVFRCPERSRGASPALTRFQFVSQRTR